MVKRSLAETIFITLFQSFGILSFCPLFVSSSSHCVWSCSVTERVVFSFDRGKKSVSSKARLLPVLMTLFIHWKKRKENQLTFSSLSPLEIFLYPLLSTAMTKEANCRTITIALNNNSNDLNNTEQFIKGVFIQMKATSNTFMWCCLLCCTRYVYLV